MSHPKPINVKATAIARATVRKLLAEGHPHGHAVWQAAVNAAAKALGGIVPEGHAVVSFVDDPEWEENTGDPTDWRTVEVRPDAGEWAGYVYAPRNARS